VIFIEHRGLYMTKGDLPDEEYLTPIDEAHVVREGDDVTILSWLGSVAWAESVADSLAEQGVSAEVVDLRSLSPIDYATIEASVAKTGRVAIVHEAIRTGGLGAEIAATLHERAADLLKAPVQRFGARFVPMPVAPSLQEHAQPRLDDIVTAVAAQMTKSAA
jgi:pyruvate dehydrogenase E1 component beta subunit